MGIIKPKEIEKVSALDAFGRYQHFIKRVADLQKLYTLNSKDGNWAQSDVDDFILYPIWPFKEYAVNCMSGAWENFEVVEFDLNDFLDNALPLIVKEGFLLNVFPVGDKTGFVVN
ncbi:MAG TPA: DUF2750 domain-containing protein, partial [Mucilaginibacter sp.]